MDSLEKRRAQREAARGAASRPVQAAGASPAVARYVRAEAAMSKARPPAPVTGLRPAAELVATARRQVLVGFDDSAGGYLAVEQAAREAAWRHWPLLIMHAQSPSHSERRRKDARSTGADLLADAAERARAIAGTERVTTALKVGAAAGELVAASSRAGLVVVGTRGLGGLAELFAGSVAVHVAAEATAPVLVVRIPPRLAGPDWTQHPVLVGIDGSAAGYAAFEFAVAEARLRGVGILAVHAATEPGPDPLHAGVLSGFDTHCMGVKVDRRRVARDPRQALVGLSAYASAVVVGARGTGGFDALRSGSVAQALIHRSHSPLFIIHDTDGDR